MCKAVAESLKRQRGNQYGFGDNPESADHIKKNLSSDLLDDSDITTTKPIENFFGNLDRELKKAGSQGFSKVSDDLVIKYSKDIIKKNPSAWRTKANRQKAKKLKSLEIAFKDQQKSIANISLTDDEAAALCTQNQILKCIESCKKKHGGPVTTNEELDELVINWTSSEKDLHSSLNQEIRLRKLTFTKVKSSCPLFRQQKLSIEEKVQNLRSLISTQLDLKVLADMDDLESAIREEDGVGADQNEDAEMIDVSSPYQRGDFIVGLFTSGIYPGEVLSVVGDQVTADFLVAANIRQSTEEARYWKRSSTEQNETYEISKHSILPICPVLAVSKYSTNRTVVYELLNVDLILKFV